MARALSLKIIRRRIRELQSKADKLERAEKPGIKQLRAVLKKFRLDPVDVQLALNTSRKSKLQPESERRERAAGTHGAWSVPG